VAGETQVKNVRSQEFPKEIKEVTLMRPFHGNLW